MSWIDWTVTLVPLCFIYYFAFRAGKEIRGVADFLAAGRVCGRYVISVSDAANGLAVLTLVAFAEVHYKTGFVVGFWGGLLLPLSLILSLTGFCSYRYRETRALSLGQFFEMRYNRPLRICASVIKTISEMLANMICPAVAARFLIYLLGIPLYWEIFGYQVQTFALLLALVIIMAVAIILMGGALALIITDTVQMLLSYPIFVVFSIFILCNFSWFDQIGPVMMDRVPHESFLNPFDIKAMRDFNLFAVFVTAFSMILNRGSWYGGQGTSAGKTPHEQKMAGILGTWRSGFSTVFYVLIGITLIVVLNHEDFSARAKTIRDATSVKVVEEIIPDAALRRRIVEKIHSIPEQKHRIGVDKPLSQEENLETPYMNAVHSELTALEGGNSLFQQFRTLYNQMMLALTMRHLLPVGLTGLFVFLMIMLMISTDDTRIFNSSLTIMQDIIMPNLKRPLSPEQHIFRLRLCSVGVGIFFFCGSLFMAQMDYINLFCIIMTSIWLCGAGPIVVFGLYTKFGNSTGAFCSLCTGSFVGIFGSLIQRRWADLIYPILEQREWIAPLDNFLQFVSRPFNPYILWKMDPVKFPVNSTEIFFIGMLAGIVAYFAGSWLTYRKPYNLDRLLHRGIYSESGTAAPKAVWNFRYIFSTLIGITSDYTKGDRIIAWSVFLFSFCYSFMLSFVGVVIWNLVTPWPAEWWGAYFLISTLVVPGILAAISTVWFMTGGILDLRRLFLDLRSRNENPEDNGQVCGEISLADKKRFEKTEM